MTKLKSVFITYTADDGLHRFNSNHWLEWQPTGPCPVTCGMGFQDIERECYEVTPGGCSDEGDMWEEGFTMCYPGECEQGMNSRLSHITIAVNKVDIFQELPCETEDGKTCIFPFLLDLGNNRTELIEGCTLIDGNIRPWCSTKLVMKPSTPTIQTKNYQA